MRTALGAACALIALTGLCAGAGAAREQPRLLDELTVQSSALLQVREAVDAGSPAQVRAARAAVPLQRPCRDWWRGAEAPCAPWLSLCRPKRVPAL